MLRNYYFKNIYLAPPGFSCSMQSLQLWHVGSKSLTKDCPLNWEFRVLATGPPGKFQEIIINFKSFYSIFHMEKLLFFKDADHIIGV